MNINQKIKQIARLKNLSAKEFGGRIGRSSQAIYDIYSERVSINVKLLEKIAVALDEPIVNFFIESPDADDQNLDTIEISDIHRLMVNIHESAKEGLGMFHLRIHKSTEGGYMLESFFSELKNQLEEKDIIKYGNQVYESIRISSPELTREEKKEPEKED